MVTNFCCSRKHPKSMFPHTFEGFLDTSGGASDVYFSSCKKEFQGLSCDDLGEYGLTCDLLRSRYHLECAGCKCESSGCIEDDCDILASEYDFSCSTLEDAGYNCTGCLCPRATRQVIPGGLYATSLTYPRF